MVLGVPSIRILNMTALGPFSWRWPADVESFKRGWIAVADIDGHEARIRHGIGNRIVFWPTTHPHGELSRAT